LRIAAVAFESQNGMMITDPQGRILRVNPAFTRLTGYGALETAGRTPAMLNANQPDNPFYRRLWESLHEEGFWQGEITNQRKNGQTSVEMQTVTAIVAPDRGVTHYVCCFTDITEQKAAEAAAHRLAYYDPLTKLPNRRLLLDRLCQALAVTARTGRHGAILFIDLDNFKALNDTRGHGVRDLLLAQVAQRLRVDPGQY
jgi:PAS domain S-box-containing protein